MLKKSLIFGSAALLLAALITLTGCPTSVDDGSSGTVYAHRIYGLNVDPYTAQEAIDRAVAAGEPIVLEPNLTIQPAGHLNFKNARVTIAGDVTFAGGVVNVVDAAVDWAPGAEFELGHYIHRKGMSAAGHVDPAYLVEYADSLDTIMATAQAAAVRRFTLGPKADHDYSTDSAGISARIVAESLGTLYILDTLTLPIDGTAPSAVDITALGTLDVTGTRPGVTLDAVGASDLILGTCSTLTSSQGGVIVYTPGAATIPSVEIQEGKPFTIQQAAAGPLEIPGKLKGRGTLEVSTGANAITIKGGEGNIRFTGNAAPTKIESDSTGTLTFDNGFASLNGASWIAGDVEFRGNVSTSKALKLLGNVTLVNGMGIILNTTEDLTLGAGKTVSVKITPTAAGSGTTLAPVLAAGSGNVILTPAAGVTLTAAAAPSKNTEEAVNLAKKITLGGDDLTITIGTLQVAPGAIFEVNDETLTTHIPTGAPFDEIGYLAVADTGALSLTNAGSSLVVLGDTQISAATAVSTLKAAGGTVILGNNKIAGDAPGASLTAATGGTGLAITLDNAAAGGTVLILQQVNLNLALHGGLVITGQAINNQVTLADLAKITLNNGEGGRVTDRNKIGAAGNFATLNGDFEAVTAGTATTSQAAWSVAHKGGSYVRIVGASGSNVSLAKSGTSFVQ